MVCRRADVRASNRGLPVYGGGRAQHSAGDHQAHRPLQLPRAPGCQSASAGLHQEVSFDLYLIKKLDLTLS